MTDENDGRRRAIAWVPLLVSLALVGTLIVEAIASRDDDPAPVVAAATTPPAPATAPAEETPPATTADSGESAEVPVEVQEDPIVKKLARGRTLPFTAGPWKKAAWRDGVFTRLRPVTQERAEKVDQDGGFGILIQ